MIKLRHWLENIIIVLSAIAAVCIRLRPGSRGREPLPGLVGGGWIGDGNSSVVCKLLRHPSRSLSFVPFVDTTINQALGINCIVIEKYIFQCKSMLSSFYNDEVPRKLIRRQSFEDTSLPGSGREGKHRKAMGGQGRWSANREQGNLVTWVEIFYRNQSSRV